MASQLEELLCPVEVVKTFGFGFVNAPAVSIRRFSLSPDQKVFAVCSNSSTEVWVYHLVEKGRWARAGILGEHSDTVADIDISQSGKILTCSHDRNAYVWRKNEENVRGDLAQAYLPELVDLNSSHGTLCCRWSPDESKFVVGNVVNEVVVCFYSTSQKIWLAKKVRNTDITGPITSCIFCGNMFVAVGSADNHTRIYSVHLKHEKREDTQKSAPGFGTLVAQLAKKDAWVTCIDFCISAMLLAVGQMDSTITLYSMTSKEQDIIKWSSLPFTALLFHSSKVLVACGYDYQPVLFYYQEGPEGPSGVISEPKKKRNGHWICGGILAPGSIIQQASVQQNTYCQDFADGRAGGGNAVVGKRRPDDDHDGPASKRRDSQSSANKRNRENDANVATKLESPVTSQNLSQCELSDERDERLRSENCGVVGTKRNSENQASKNKDGTAVDPTRMMPEPSLKHKRQITDIRKAGKEKFMTSGADGQILLWDLKHLVNF